MKKYIFILIAMISYSLTAQNSARVYNQNVIPGKAGDVVNLFNNFFGEAEYKSGGVMLQSVSFRNNVTHRIVFYGDPSNWGEVEQRPQGAWSNFLGQLRNLTIPNPQDNALLSIISWSSGDTEEFKAAKIWDINVENPSKMKAAFDELTEKNQDILGGRSVGLVQYDAGGPDGATHGIVLYGKNVNDLTLKEREIRSTKQFADYVSKRGNVEYVKTYIVNVVSRF